MMTKMYRRIAWLTLIAATLVCGCGQSGDPLAVGTDVHDFSIVTADKGATPIRFADLKGKVVLIDFWATWCPPCRESLPHIQSLWRDYKGKGLQVLAISNEDPVTIQRFGADQKFEMPFCVDSHDEANNAFKITGLPTTLLIDKTGRVLFSTVGIDDTTETELDEAVRQALL